MQQSRHFLQSDCFFYIVSRCNVLFYTFGGSKGVGEFSACWESVTGVLMCVRYVNALKLLKKTI